MNEQNKPTPVIIPKKINKCDDPIEYLHLKNKGRISIDEQKYALYKKRLEHSKEAKRQVENDFDDFAFEQVRNNGKLNIVEFDDSDSDDEMNKSQVFNDEQLLLSKYERQSLCRQMKNHWHTEQSGTSSSEKNDSTSKKISVKTSKETSINISKETSEKTSKQIKVIADCDCIMCSYVETSDGLIISRNDQITRQIANESNKSVNDKKDDVTVIEDDEDDLTIVHEVSNNSDKDEISILSEKTNGKRNTETTFRPYKEYWMHRFAIRRFVCDTPLRWHLLERDLPVNFRWLLNECARMIEVEACDLYQELAAMETYYADCLVVNYDCSMAGKFYNSLQHRDKSMVNTNAKKWVNEYGMQKRMRNKKSL